MEKIDYEVDDFMNHCDYKGLSPKTKSKILVCSLDK